MSEGETNSLTTLMCRSMLRSLTLLIGEPATSIPTLVYYSGLIPHNVVLLRMVRHELLIKKITSSIFSLA
ncbi:transmembrane protein, putative [Medicago truncatula]|uniref:Transmembrane protein, putative n=1 Tax=Medicago truncatula TaxID=3880 RepID=A0A072UDE1_MEDTR|nr:transmembrane protein, putative [Medicago truncatula]